MSCPRQKTRSRPKVSAIPYDEKELSNQSTFCLPWARHGRELQAQAPTTPTTHRSSSILLTISRSLGLRGFASIPRMALILVLSDLAPYMWSSGLPTGVMGV